ncbi:serine hydrolase [Curtobacterium sp. MCBD17_028]|uniref:serine hydrolase n=1 Tax=Curtobacterium sp. MCBD17_028 TaxID=2175670 RepID=UPI000DA9181E|nr:serine hydrolase [Curtobacterium sp. MCBD17_028]PZE22932.1 penicillin-binding protein [Curtobacterium sp. MCBD17_028]
MTNAEPSAAALDAYRGVLPYIADWVAYKVWQLRVPGVQVAVGYQGEVVWSTAYGYADVEAGRRLTEHDLFRIASHSKTFTATALMLLAERGQLRLDDTVGTYVPALVDAGSPIADATVRELMEHGAGVLRDGLDGDYWSLARPFPDEDELLALVLDQGSKVPVGSSFNYSNLGYSLLGMVVAAVSGRPYNDYVREEIIEPLGLRDTGPDWDPTRADDFVVGYTGFHVDRTRSRLPHVDTRAMASATGFHGTAEDLVRYFSAHVIGQGELLSDHAKRQAQRRAWTAEDDPASRGYGMGFIVDRVAGHDVRGHSGGFPGHITQSLFDPTSSLVISVMTNAAAGPATLLAQGILRLLDAAADTAAPGDALSDAPDDVDVDTLTGRFANPWGVADIARIGDRLLEIDPSAPGPLDSVTRLTVTGPDTVRMSSGNRFGSVDEDIRYTRDDDGTVTAIRAGGGMSMTPWAVPGDESPAVAAGLA